jgi:conjugative relaxase-like TrwC/TraI family protein
MAMDIRRRTVHEGYRYFMHSAVSGDRVREAGTPLPRGDDLSGTAPGTWLGAGLAGLDRGRGLALDSIVSEQQMSRLFGSGCDPVCGERLGRRRYQNADPRHGRPVAGFDLLFTAAKSVSTLWALADDDLRQTIWAAHRAAVISTIDWIETNVAATRTGRAGAIEVETRGLVAAAFDHWDSRAGDPHVHTHVVVANRVQGLDGSWRSLHARPLFAATVAASAVHEGLLADELTRRLGVAWETQERPPHSQVPQWDIIGVPDELMTAFSQRSAAVASTRDRLVDDFQRQKRRDPTTAEMVKLDYTAWLLTPRAKQAVSLSELTDQWRERASIILGQDSNRWARNIIDASSANALGQQLHRADGHHIAAATLDAVEQMRSTWNRRHVESEVARQLMGYRSSTPHLRAAALAAITDRVLGSSVPCWPPMIGPLPEALLRPDGTSRLEHRGVARFTSSRLLRAEAVLLQAGRDLTGPSMPEPEPVAVAAGGGRLDLAVEHVSVIGNIVTSGRTLDVLTAHTGAEKSAALAALRDCWEAGAGHGSVVGMTSSAVANRALVDDLGIPTEEPTRWLNELGRQAERRDQIRRILLIGERERALLTPGQREAIDARLRDHRANLDRWRLHPGQLVILDEASQLGTVALARLVGYVRSAGAKLLLVGEREPLGAVRDAGAFAALVDGSEDPLSLEQISRFQEPWERDASLRLRAGDLTIMSDYLDRGRIRFGIDSTDALTQAISGWVDDARAGRRSLLVTNGLMTAIELNARARDVRIADGVVEVDGVTLRDGNVAGVGDTVIARHDRGGSGIGNAPPVRYGDLWTVTERRHDGSLTVRDPTGDQAVTLPAAYVAKHLDLGYAVTVYQAQSTTVDTAHSVIAPSSVDSRGLYVAMTRGREANTLYVTSGNPHGSDPDVSANLVGIANGLGAIVETVAKHDLQALAASQHAERLRLSLLPDNSTIPEGSNLPDHLSEDRYRALEERESRRRARDSGVIER